MLPIDSQKQMFIIDTQPHAADMMKVLPRFRWPHQPPVSELVRRYRRATCPSNSELPVPEWGRVPCPKNTAVLPISTLAQKTREGRVVDGFTQGTISRITALHSLPQGSHQLEVTTPPASARHTPGQSPVLSILPASKCARRRRRNRVPGRTASRLRVDRLRSSQSPWPGRWP